VSRRPRVPRTPGGRPRKGGPNYSMSVVKTPFGNALVLLPEIHDDYPTEIKNALAMRNDATINGRCRGCGATGPSVLDSLAGATRGSVEAAVFTHEADCPAGDDVLIGLFRTHGLGAA
jgi:hypothetical protein